MHRNKLGLGWVALGWDGFRGEHLEGKSRNRKPDISEALFSKKKTDGEALFLTENNRLEPFIQPLLTGFRIPGFRKTGKAG